MVSRGTVARQLTKGNRTMPANLRRHGYKGSINMDETGALTTFAPVASMNKWSISMKRERADVTCFLDPNRVWAQGLFDVSGDVAGMWEASASRALIDVMMGDAAVGLKLVPSELDATTFFSGPGVSRRRHGRRRRRRDYAERIVCRRRSVDAGPPSAGVVVPDGSDRGARAELARLRQAA